MAATKIEGVGAFIYSISTKRYLFLLRNSSKYSGTWAMPGGKVDKDESISVSLLREINEELRGLCPNDPSTPKIIPIEKFTSDNGNFVYHTFIIPVATEFLPILNEEHRGFCWVELDDNPKPLHPGVWRTINFEAVTKKIKTIEKIFTL